MGSNDGPFLGTQVFHQRFDFGILGRCPWTLQDNNMHNENLKIILNACPKKEIKKQKENPFRHVVSTTITTPLVPYNAPHTYLD